MILRLPQTVAKTTHRSVQFRKSLHARTRTTSWLSYSDEFNVYTHEAGAGVLSVAIEGPSNAVIEITDTQTGFVTVGYIVRKAGWFFFYSLFFLEISF
jgi:hypothetical protein